MTVVAIAITEGEVRRSIVTAQTHLERAAEEIVWQIESRAWEQIGYGSWDEMREAEYGGAAVIVPRADRPQLVARLRGEGLSRQSIGDTLGVRQSTVSEDLLNNDSDIEQPLTIVNTRGQQRPTTYAPRPPANVDGRAKRRPLPEQAKTAGWDLRKVTERIERIVADDRFAANRESILPHLRGHLEYMIETAERLLVVIERED